MHYIMQTNSIIAHFEGVLMQTFQMYFQLYVGLQEGSGIQDSLLIVSKSLI